MAPNDGNSAVLICAAVCQWRRDGMRGSAHFPRSLSTRRASAGRLTCGYPDALWYVYLHRVPGGRSRQHGSGARCMRQSPPPPPPPPPLAACMCAGHVLVGPIASAATVPRREGEGEGGGMAQRAMHRPSTPDAALTTPARSRPAPRCSVGCERDACAHARTAASPCIPPLPPSRTHSVYPTSARDVGTPFTVRERSTMASITAHTHARGHVPPVTGTSRPPSLPWLALRDSLPHPTA
jgi:hypothetical protein